MSMYTELSETIEMVLSNTNESSEFKRGFKKLIENFLENSSNDDDIREILNLVSRRGEDCNED